MNAATDRLHLPRIGDGPLVGPSKPRFDRTEDWTEIEALLASPDPSFAAAPRPARQQRVALILVPSLAGSLAFAGLLTLGLYGVPAACGPDGCVTPATQTSDIADVGASSSGGDAASPIVQGRSVSASGADKAGIGPMRHEGPQRDPRTSP